MNERKNIKSADVVQSAVDWNKNMKFELLKAGLEMLKYDDKYAADAKLAIAEINEVQARLGKNNETWSDECFVLAAWTVDNMLIETTYDDYGRLYAGRKAIGHEVDFTDYEMACRRNLGLEALPLSAVMLGFDIVSSLYADNEADGNHNPDGTFKVG